MALCHNCDDTRDEYIGNGVQKEYQITFEYNDREDVAVAFWNEDLLVWEPVPNTEWVFQHDTLIRFNDAPAYGQKFIIYRCTDLEPLPAEFYPGTPIKAKDLNDNFFVLKSAIEEVRCAVNRNDNKSEEKYWDKVDDTIRYEEQINGEAEPLLDDEHIFDAEAIAARHDSYVSDTKPADLPYEQPGKIWWDTDDLMGRWWDPAIGAWVTYGTSGPAGPPGDFGPPGRMIISDAPPTEYPAVGSNTARPLEAGDLWFDSYNVLMYVYYIDNHGPGQWVSVSKTGPAGQDGQDGTDGLDGGNFPDAPVDGTTYGRKDATWVPVTAAGSFSVKEPLKLENNELSIDLLTIPNAP